MLICLKVMNSEKEECRGCSHAAGNTRGARADLHVHSKYSDRPSEWFLRRIGAPESFEEPITIYERCKARGMDYVTISDHNCIRGALEIAHLPGVFISSELTTYFPEDRCKIHCLVSGITSQQFADMQEIREDIYELRAYMLEHRIVHTIAHPFFRVNDRLTTDHVEKLMVMFNRFEGINGSRHQRACAVAKAIMGGLNQQMLERLADKHGIEPEGDSPWQKVWTGGSDDHGGLYVAGAYTETPEAATVFDYLEHLRAGRHEPGGAGGSSLQLANSLIHIARAYVQQRLSQSGSGANLVQMIIQNFEERRQQENASAASKAIRKVFEPVVRRHRLKQLSEAERMLVNDFLAIMEQERTEEADAEAMAHEARFEMIARLAHQLTFLFMGRCLDKVKKGDLMGSVQSLASMSPVALGVLPYMTAFSTQHKDNDFLRDLCKDYPVADSTMRGTGGRAWITDTLVDVNGVSKTIHKLAGLASTTDRPITVLASSQTSLDYEFPTMNFEPVGTFSLPEYPELTFSLPPVLDIIRHIEAADYESLLISTPGPMGLVGLIAARVLGIPAKGIYHTDFPHYIETWTDDASMGELTKQVMRWFYMRMEHVYAPTQAYIEVLADLGFERDRLSVLPRGVDPHDFNVSFRDPDFWRNHGLVDTAFNYLYVGRVSSEKNVEVMMEAHQQLLKEGLSVGLAVVGDGPELANLKATYGNCPEVAFTGYLHGKELATAFASADALVFPSESDTFGNVVLEAHASGLPAIVSDKGGPKEIVQSHDSGLVASAKTPTSFAKGMRELLEDEAKRKCLGERALISAADSRWEAVLDIL